MTTSALDHRYWAAADGNKRATASSSADVADEEITHFEQVVTPRPGMTAVDLACGTGQWARRLAAWGMTVTAFDSYDKALAQAESAGPYPGLTYLRWDIVADPIPPELAPGRFDIITCRYSLPHLEPGRLLTDVGRWLKPDGIFYALVRVGLAHGPAGHHARIHPDEQLAEVSPFPEDISDEYVRHLGVGWAYRAVHELGPRRRVIVLSEYGDSAGRCPAPETGRAPRGAFPA